MCRDKHQSIALGVSIALSAGVFSIMPSASAAPVLDHVVSGGAVVDQTTSPQVTDVTSTTRNNVIDWKDFSVAQGEMVRFDGGAKTNNYLNVVSGVNTSHIDGVIKGGDNVYIVNPNGVVFGNSASVDVGSLYVSSRPLDAVNYDKVDSNGDMQPLADTASMSGGDIVNMGTVQANSVFLEGGNIVITDVDKIKTADGVAVNNNVTVQTQGKITLARDINTIVAEEEAQKLASNKSAVLNDNVNMFSFANTTEAIAAKSNTAGAGYTFTFNNSADTPVAISNDTGLNNLATRVNNGTETVNNYILTADIEINGTFTPIGINKTYAFKGTFDGDYHTVKGISVSNLTYGGLFGYTSDATIKNVGVSGGSVTSTAAKESCVGGIAGYAEDTKFINVFNEGTEITANSSKQSRGGGIVGKMYGGSIFTAYNTATVNGGNKYVGGILGAATGTVTIDNVYNTGLIANSTGSGRGIIARTEFDDTDAVTLNNAYSTQCDAYNADAVHFASTPTYVIKAALTTPSYYAEDYKDKLSGVSYEGGKDTVWRIYEGKTRPYLRAFLTGHGTVTVDYHYDQGSSVSADKGANDLEVTYNGNDIKVSNPTYTKGGIGFTPVYSITPPTNNTIDGNIKDNVNYANGEVRTLAAFSTGQQGYDLVGNNYTITPRTVTIDKNSVTATVYDRPYDGTNDASGAVKDFSYGGVNGIIKGDNTVTIDSSNVKAYFVGDEGSPSEDDAPDVGDNKTILVSGSVTVTNKDGYHNYVVSGGDVSGKTFDGNSITPKVITVSLKNPKDIEKTYDGDAKVKGTNFLPEAQFADIKENSIVYTNKTETITLAYDDTAYYTDKIAGDYTNKVKYTGIKIGTVTNGKASNYKLVDAEGNTIYSISSAGTETGTGTLYGSGKIKRIKLSNEGFSWVIENNTPQKVEREYNNSSVYTNPVGSTVDSAETLAIDDDMTFTVTSAKFLASASESAAEVKNAGDNYYVGYTVTVTGNDVVNYTFGDNNEAIDSSVTLFGSGKITPRTIKIGVDSSKSADKMYDATATVLDNDSTASFAMSEKAADDVKFNDSYHLLKYTGGDDYKLLNDGAKIVYTGVYKQKNSEGDANVNFDGTQVADKNITYTAVIEGGNGNYVFDGSTETNADNNPQITFANGKGKITQREISNLYFKDVTKVYDTTANVNHDDIALNVGEGNNQVNLYGEDKPEDVFDLTNVTGVYKAVADGKEDADAETDKDVIYSGISGIIKNHNYKLGSNIGSTATGKGTISPKELSDTDIKISFADTISKVYDATDAVAFDHTGDKRYFDSELGTISATAESYVNSLTVGGVTLTLGDNGDYKVYSAKYNSAGVDANKATYVFTLQSNKLDNFDMKNLSSALYDQTNKRLTLATDSTTNTINTTSVSITKKLLQASLNDTVLDLNRTYNGTANLSVSAADAASKVTVTGFVDNTVIDTDKVNGRYVDRNVAYDTDGNVTTKDVLFDVKLKGTGAANYVINDTNDNSITLTGANLGKITPATLTVTFTPNPVTKIYDGEKGFTGEVTPAYSGIKKDDTGDEDVVALKKFTTIAGERYYSAAEFDTADKGTNKDVYYTVELEGADKGNYVLANSETTEGVTIMTGKGTISPKQLSDTDIKISFADIISKVYDATDNVSFDHTGDGRYFDSELGNIISATAESYVNNLTVGGVTLTMGDNGDYKVYSAHYNSAGVGANKATYVFTLQGNKLDNFDMTHLSSTLYDQTNKRLTLATDSATNTINTTSVSITPKLLQASLNETVLDLDRTYNGTASLPVSAADVASKVTVTGFVNDNGDATAFDDNLVNGRYVDRNVAYDAVGDVTTKNVLFDVKLKGNGKENYVINDTNVNSTILTGENLGKITPKELSVDFDYTEKTYNNNPDAAVTGITFTGLQTDDKALTLNTAAIVAQFGSKDGDTFTANGDVNYIEGADDPVGYKGVQYSNLQNAMEIGFGEDATGYKIAKNYTIADTVYFSEAVHKGKIKRLGLTQEYIKNRWDTVTKEYDGTDAAPEGKLHIYTNVLGDTEDKWVDLNYVLEDTNGAVYDNQQVNVVSGHGVTYTLNGLEAKEFHNFEMTQVLMDSFNGKQYTTTGNITPRVLSINIKNPDNWVKVYDGGTEVKDDKGNVQNEFAYDFVKGHDILEQDTPEQNGNVNLIVTGAYENKKANIEPEDTKTTKGKTIKYTLTLTGNTAGNYTLDSTNTTAGAETETDSTRYIGDGAIKKRIVYAAFDEGYGTGIDRYYAGANDTSADADKTQRDHINLLASTGGDTGLLTSDASVTLIKTGENGIKANYASANVARNPQTKKVTTQDVYFTNFNLQGDGSENYVVKSKDVKNPDRLTGQGTIKPVTVTVGLKQVPDKEYDRTEDIKDIEATSFANDNFNFVQDPNHTVVAENVANYISEISGSYENADAGSKDANYADKEYSYTLTLNNGNYELISGDDNGRTVTASNEGMKATVTGADGIIKPRTISLKEIADMTKVYDGTTDADVDYMNNLEKNITFNNVVNNESLKLTGTAVYNDDANASDAETTAKPKKHQVKYTVNIGNTNYRLDDGTQYGTQDLTDYGDGYINRRTLSLVATPTSVNVGESMPAFTGTVTGFAGNEATLYSDFISYVKDNFKAADGANTSTPGSYGVYGWYMGNKTGLLGLNYQFDQAPANATAFTVNYVNNNTGNPDTKITPNNSIYHQISKDMNSGFGDNGAAAIEYKDKSGKVLGTEKIDSGEINGKGLMIGGGTDMSTQADSNANIGIAGGDIVNMEGANAAGSVNIETNGEGTVVNLEVFSIDEEKKSGTNNSTAEITNMDSQNGMASIEIQDEKQNIIGEDVRDKRDEKEGKIAIKSSNGEDDDEIELTVEKQGVNVA